MPHDALRMLDANLNRAAEALRVIEDYARFARDDRDASATAKDLRHKLNEAARRIGRDALLAARNASGDVGRHVKATAETHRGSLLDVIRAEFGRLAQSLRVLGEVGKLASPALAETAERIRYDAYTLEQSVVLRGEVRARLRNVRLYVIVCEAACAGEWFAAAEGALSGGARCLQLREKSLPDAELLRRARALRGLTHRHGALLIINDRPDIARLADADGVHVGQEDMSVAEARRVAGAAALVGKSTHTREQIDAAILESPDYIAVGPMYASKTKPQTLVAGPRTLAYAAERTELPLVAIGGITPRRVSAVRSAAKRAILCACSAVIGKRDPAPSARAVLSQVNRRNLRKPK